jgi:hypothetical protein
MSRKHLPAAVLVSIGCSVAFRGALGLHRAHDALQVTDAARQAIDPGDHQPHRLAQEVEHGAQLVAAGRGGAAALLSKITSVRSARSLAANALNLLSAFGGIADMAELAAGSTWSRMTHSGHLV